MKKLIVLTIATFIFASPLFAETDTTQQINIENITEAERIIDKYSEKIYNTFSNAVDTATPIAINGFKMVQKLVIAKGIGMILPLFVFILFMYLFKKEYVRIEKLTKESIYGPFDENNITPFLLIHLLGGILFFLISLFTVYKGILMIAASEWYALKEILNLIN